MITRGERFYFLFVFLLFSFHIFADDFIYRAQIDALQSEIRSAKNDTIVVRKMVDLAALLHDGFDEKINYLEDGVKRAKQLGMKPEMGLFYWDMGWYYFFRNDRDNTIKYFKEATLYCDNPEFLIYAYGCLCNTYSWSGEHDLALSYAERGVEVAKESELKNVIADAYMFLGDVYRYKEDKERARSYYADALTLLDLNQDYFSVLRVMANIYIGDTTLITPYHFFDYARKLKYFYEAGPPRKRQIFTYNIIKAADTSVFTTEKEKMKTRQLQEQKRQMIFFIIIILLLAIIAILLIYQVNVKRKANTKLQQANEIKSRLFVILNHDLRQPIASLASYLELKSVNPSAISEKEAVILEQQMAKSANQLFASMDKLLIWAKNQMQSFCPDPQDILLTQVFDDVRAFFCYEDRVEIKYQIEKNLWLKTDENYLKTIIRNLTLNAIDAPSSARGPITWKAYGEGDNIILSIENHGKKIALDKIDLLYTENKNKISKKGAGLIIIRDLAEVIKCKIEIETGEEYGTIFRLIFKKI